MDLNCADVLLLSVNNL